MEEPRPAEPEELIRQAILDPFGSLALEGAGGRVQIQATISCEPPPKVAVEDVVFDIDEIEILKS